MRRGNGEGSIIKLGGKRRRPYAVRITVGYTDEGKQKFKYLGYYEKITEARTALRKYLVNPYDLCADDLTLTEIYKEWERKSELSKSSLQNYHYAFKQAPLLHKMKIRDVKAIHIETAMESMKPSMQKALKNILSQLYSYAMKHELVEKNIIGLIKVKSAPAPREKIPFTKDEIEMLKSMKHPMSDIIVILLYTGMRITELLEIESENVFLEERYMIGGKKTKAGRDRIIPIHDEIYDLIAARLAHGKKRLFTHNGYNISYQTFRQNLWNKLTERFSVKHTPHDTRHTFATYADKCGMNKTATKRIIGHTLKDMTDHYTHKDVGELLAEINKLRY